MSFLQTITAITRDTILDSAKTSLLEGKGEISSKSHKAMIAVAESALHEANSGMLLSASADLLEAIGFCISNLALDVAVAILKRVLQKQSSFEKDVKKLLRAPLKTGMERLRVATSLESDNSLSAVQHRHMRYREALFALDEAFVIADEVERPPICFLRGLTASRIPGASTEARAHLAQFVDFCSEGLPSLQRQIEEHEKAAARAAAKAAEIVVPVTWGIGGRSFGGTEVSSLKLEKAQLLHDAREESKKTQILREELVALHLNVDYAKSLQSAAL